MVFALLDARTHCWSMLVLLSASTAMLLFISAGLLSSLSTPILNLALPCPRWRFRHWGLFNSMPLTIAQLSNLRITLCKASHPLRESAVPIGIVSKLAKTAFNSYIQITDKNTVRNRPMIEPWGTLLVSPGRCSSIHCSHWSPIIHRFLPCEPTHLILQEVYTCPEGFCEGQQWKSYYKESELGSLWMEYAKQML